MPFNNSSTRQAQLSKNEIIYPLTPTTHGSDTELYCIWYFGQNVAIYNGIEAQFLVKDVRRDFSAINPCILQEVAITISVSM